MRGDRYQIALIFLGFLITGLFAAFFYREIFPEYKIYQKKYVQLEDFRSTYTGEPAPAFQYGIKQILIENKNNGPVSVDRCISCHVATQLPHFSPTKIAKDSEGKIIRDAEGVPIQEPNDQYVWKKLDDAIDSLVQQGKTSEADNLKKLKTAHVGEHIYDVTKVLQAHPLIGKETRPFEFHPIDQYGCTSCHNGNGRGLTTNKAHGPVFDGEYEAEFTGEKPSFTEPDPKNDPLFARMFNSKPGHELIFQTRPILVGALVQANCVQCHNPNQDDTLKALAEVDHITKKSDQLSTNIALEIDSLTKNFQNGEELFISQACYACHRISGFARGGIGPELTNAGANEPWYLKESIVWPQADLKTSTMPNFRLDHPELQDLVTFLLAQHGRPKTKSETDYKVETLEWESGKKLPWEKPINPGHVHDLRASMTIFASEGCAACHRLQGFESNVGFKVEKDNAKPDFNVLYKEREWFSKLFPEMIVGSDIVESIDKNTKEIDSRIVDNVRENSLLEELETNHPGLIESFYSNFAYASRAKNDLSDKAEIAKWQDRVRRVLMIYIQEYGLGRIVGPKPNWSGIYRSDEWLIEHFRKPTQHIPRSIMPVFPFDDSKFYALTYMLDTLAKKNRDQVRQIWDHNGFNPSQAYKIHCSQCHGEYLHGDGPVAEWIYPIPKNLRNADFLRNFTKHNVVYSIMHGVTGTPMPPWGEVAKGKIPEFEPAVLNENEIHQLVDWIFAFLLGGEVIKQSSDVPKWHYQPQDAVKELEMEGNELKAGPPPQFLDLNEPKPKEKLPKTEKTNNDEEIHVSNIFDIKPNPIPDGEKDLFFIKKKYFTEENIQKGQAFFELNCAVCHGKEADGLGFRAESMYEAKPRMLTNLHWIDSRDDLRLLRSIKYGVPGTAMTPWGDLTSSLQRMQLVIYIRSLNLSQQQRDDLFNALYAAFDVPDQLLEVARGEEYKQINAIKEKLDSIKKQRMENKDKDVKELVKLFEEEINTTQVLTKHQEADQTLLKIKNILKEESRTYQEMGVHLISKSMVDTIFEQYLNLLNLHSIDYTYENGVLHIRSIPEKEAKSQKIEKELIENLNKQIAEIKKENQPDKLKEMEKLQTILVSGFAQTKLLRQKQLETYQIYVEKLKELKKE